MRAESFVRIVVEEYDSLRLFFLGVKNVEEKLLVSFTSINFWV